MVHTLLLLQSDGYSPIETVGLLAFSTGVYIFMLIIYFFSAYCQYKIFLKAGVKNAWGAFIPIYNTYLLITEVVKVEWWWIILLFIPIVNIFVYIYILYRLAKFFDKRKYYIILFYFFIGYIILAFGNAKYNPSALPARR